MLNIQLLNSPHPFAANSYLLSSDGEFAVVDPTTPFDEGLIDDGKLRYILLTHAHFDHILDVDSWANAGGQVIILEDERKALKDPMRNCFKLYNGTDNGYFGEAKGLRDGDSLPLGQKTIKIIACPGHTIGSAAYLVENHAFVGDTVFAGGGYGRFDLPSGNFTLLRESIKRLASLPEAVIFYPGHGETTTVKQYRQDIGF